MPDENTNQPRKLDKLSDDAETKEAARVRQHVEDLLDHALEESFPASDPPSIALPPEWKSGQ